VEKQMIEDISTLKTDHALMKQKQDQTDKVIEKMGENLEALSTNVVQFEGKVTKGFYIACGIVLYATGSLGDVTKIVGKFIGG